MMTKVRNTRKEYMISVNNEQSIFEDTKESTLKRSAKKLKERNWSVSHQYPISNLKENNSLASNSGGFSSSNFENSLKNKMPIIKIAVVIMIDKINPNSHKWQPSVAQYVKNSSKILRYVYV